MKRVVRGFRAAVTVLVAGVELAGAAAHGATRASPARTAAKIASLPAARGTLTVTGRVVDDRGAPIASARIFIEGSRRALVSVDDRGAFATTVSLGELDAMLRSPVALWFNARATGWRIGLESGAPRLRLEIRARDDSTGARHIVVRSTDTAVTAKLARAVADGVLADSVDVRFVGVPGKDPEPEDLAMHAMADVVISPGRAVEPDSLEDDAAIAARAGGDSIAARPRARPAGGCVCRIEGVIEVRWDRPLPEPVPVTLWLEDEPTTRDSVELLLGSPRGFALEATGCGPHRVRYETHSRLFFARLTPDPVIECTRSGLEQVRIVIEPASRPKAGR